MIESQSSTGAEDQAETDTVEVGNSQTGGSSGGPWIRRFKPGLAGAKNYANGLNSFRIVSPAHPRAINGLKFFDYNFNQLLLGAQALACPLGSVYTHPIALPGKFRRFCMPDKVDEIGGKIQQATRKRK
jgi:hypothetical protein